MGKVLEFKPKTQAQPSVPEEEATPLQVALEEIKGGYSKKELDEMFDPLDDEDDEKFEEWLEEYEKKNG